ncbi:MAG TPA: DinB family protein [Candidatus Limnocylindria bacterium]|nr:DinB family protein [Candidatus Limnocylindria bacterium]
MTLKVTDDPPDRPAWVRETIRLLADGVEDWRARLLSRVEHATDGELAAGSADDWGVGQIAVHLLLIDRGVTLIALRLAHGQEAGPTGQPRPAASSVTRPGIGALAEKAAGATARLRSEFPAEPNTSATARHPYYGDLNCIGWLLTVGNHYNAHLRALSEGTASAL